MKNKLQIAPSILAANFNCLGEEISAVTNAGVSWIHYDVMDNHFVPNISFGPGLLKSLTKANKGLYWDVHLMITPVSSIIPAFAAAGADMISFHIEAEPDPLSIIKLIKSHHCQVGLAFNPNTSLDKLNEELLDSVDMLLLMSVHPGFSGQKFIDSSFDKIKQTRNILDSYYAKKKRILRLEVDGGIDQTNADKVVALGADTIVAGSYIFDSADYIKSIRAIGG